MVTVKCHTCAKKFQVKKYRLKNTKRFFCCRECNTKWKRTDEYKNIHKNRKKKELVKVNCEYCNKTIFVKKKNKHYNFCDAKCRDRYNAEYIIKEMSKNKIKVKCFQCGNDKYVHESVFKKNKNFFCCRKCYWQWRRENVPKGEDSPFYERISVNCSFCNKEIKITNWSYTNRKHHFCNPICYHKWNMSGNSKIFDPNTKPQIILNDIVNKLGIRYENEYFCDKYFIDSCLFHNNKKFFIEVNGTFWHADHRKYDKISYEAQFKGILRDKEKRAFIKNQYNIDILYLWEFDIENNAALCEKLILKYISNSKLKNYHSFNYELIDGNIKLKDNVDTPYMDWDEHILSKITKYKYA